MRVVAITGTVGVGKSTVSEVTAETLGGRGTPAAFLDLDGLSRLWPPPPGDPFRTELILANLRAVTGTYEAAGAQVLILAWVLENHEDLDAVEAATGRPVTALRLLAPPEVIEQRLRGRHRGLEEDGLEWHLKRFGELETLQDRNLQVPTIEAGASLAETVEQVIARLELG